MPNSVVYNTTNLGAPYYTNPAIYCMVRQEICLNEGSLKDTYTLPTKEAGDFDEYCAAEVAANEEGE